MVARCILERGSSAKHILIFLKRLKTMTNLGAGGDFSYIIFYYRAAVVYYRRLACLKYLVLANMLMKSGINLFDSQEAKPYKNNPEILAMTNLVRWVPSVAMEEVYYRQ